MQRDEDDDAVWRSIVENYGERPALDEPAPGPAEEPDGREASDRSEELGPAYAAHPPAPDEDRFLPPTPPPLPRPPRDRLLAWLGVFGSPAVLLVCLVTGLALPALLSYLLVAGFVGGFLYLVWHMPRGPRDPWDDGAQV